jgi:hypothetical protein
VYNAGATQTQPYVLTNCTISVDLAGGSVDARVMWLGANATIRNVTFTRSDNNGNPCIFIGDNGANSTIQNCTFGPSPSATGIINIASGAQTLNLIGCNFTGLVGGRGITASDHSNIWNIARCTFGPGIFAIYAWNSASAPGTVFNINQCKFGPAPNNWLIFAGDGSGGVMNLTNCVIFCDGIQGNLINNQANQPNNNTFNFVHCTVTETQPGGAPKSGRQLLYTAGNTAGAYNFQNCLINWPGSANTAVVGTSGGTVTAGTNFVNVSSSSGDALTGVGTELTGNPFLLSDGYHLEGFSPCVDAGSPGLTSVDIDGNARPAPGDPASGYDIGCSEVHKVSFILVSGGGSALQSAISSASSGYYIVVTDSQSYTPVTVNLPLTIMSAPGVSPNPVVVADITVNNGTAVEITGAALANSSWNGIDVAQNVAGGGGGHNVFQVDTGGGGTTYAISNCTMSINVPGGNVDAKVLGLGDKTVLYNVTLTRNDSNGNPIVSVYNNGGNSSLLTCTLGPSGGSSGLQNTANAGETLTLNNCLITGIPDPGRGIATFDHPQTYNITQCTFSGPMFTIYANNAAGGPGTVYNFNRCKLGPAPSDWLMFAGDGAGMTFNFTNSVIFSDGTRDVLISSQNGNSNNFNFVHCTFTETQPGGGAKNGRKLVFLDTTTVGTFKFLNCLVNWPASQSTALVFSSGTLANPVIAGTNLVWVGSSSGDAFRGAGTEIVKDPLMQPDGYHIKGVSPAIDAGTPNLTLVDIDGNPRPASGDPGNGFDLGCAEVLKSTVLNVSGGGTALQQALATAQAGYDFIIQDSLNYAPIAIAQNVTVEAAPGQTPTIVANPLTNNGVAVEVSGAGLNGILRGVNIVQNAAGGGAGHNVLQIDQGAGGSTFNVQNCTISINLRGGTIDARVVGVGEKTIFNNVTVTRNDNNTAGDPLVFIYNDGQNSSFLNCTFGPSVNGNGISESATAGGTLTVSNCVFTGTSTNNPALGVFDHPETVNLTRTTFGPSVYAIYAGNANSALGSVWNINQCFFGPAPANNQIIFAGDGSGTKLDFTNVVFFAGGTKVSQLVNNGQSNQWNFVQCTATETGVGGGATPGRKFLNVGLGTAPNYGNGTNGTYNLQNCIINWPGSTNIQIVAGAGPGIPKVVAGTNLVWVGGFNASESMSGAYAGIQILADPKMVNDGYHIATISPAAAAGAPNSVTADIDGNVRPATPPDPCLGATEVVKGVLTHVTGGGAALQTAINAAHAGDWLEIDDSLDYSPVTVPILLTILAGPGQTPRVVADPSVNSGTAVQVSSAGDAGTWNGITVIQNGGGGGGGHNTFFLANNGTKQVYTVENCTIAIDTSAFVDGRVSFWGNPVHLINVTVYRTDSTSYANPLLWFGDNCSSAVLDNCHVGPSAVGDSIVATASAAPNPGIVINNTEFLATSAGHRAITSSDSVQHFALNACTIDPGLGGFYVGNPGSAPGTIFSVNRCKFGPVPGTGNDWLAFGGDGSGSRIAFTNCVIFCDNSAGNLLRSSNQSNTWTLVHCTLTETQPNGLPRNGRILLDLGQGNGTNSSVTIQNCLFDWPGSSNAIVVNAAGLGLPPVTAGINLLWLPDPSTNANDAFRGSGPEIFADPEMASDGYTIGPLSPAVDAGIPYLTFVDINGTTRPLNNGFDIGAVEVFRPAYVPPTVLSLTPANGSSNVVQFASIGATIRDGTVPPDPTSYVLQLNGQTVHPGSSKNGTLTTVTYVQPGGLLGNTLYNVILTFRDTSSPTPNSFTNQWSFTTAPPLDTAAPRLQDSTSENLVVLAANHFNRNTAAGSSAWVLTNGVDSPNGIAMQAQPVVGRNVQANITQSPLMEYKVTFVTNGTHYIWVFGEGDSSPGAGAHDTCNIGLDGTLPASGTGVGGNFPLLAGFVWDDGIGNTAIATLNVPAPGEHIVEVWMQKDGLMINEVLLTTDANYVPSGEVAESPLNPARPFLTIQRTPNGTVITWTGGGTLYSAPAATGPWSPVAGASGSININPTTAHQFYQVIR